MRAALESEICSEREKYPAFLVEKTVKKTSRLKRGAYRADKAALIMICYAKVFIS